MYGRILIPTDGSTEARRGIDHGVDLAAAVGATVHAIYVVEEGGNPWMSESMDDQLDRAKEYGNEVTAEVVDAATNTGVECITAVRVGPAVHEQINEYAEEEDIDLIVMGSGYHGKLGGLLGGTAEKVLRSAAIPVTTVRVGERG